MTLFSIRDHSLRIAMPVVLTSLTNSYCFASLFKKCIILQCPIPWYFWSKLVCFRGKGIIQFRVNLHVCMHTNKSVVENWEWRYPAPKIMFAFCHDNIGKGKTRSTLHKRRWTVETLFSGSRPTNGKQDNKWLLFWVRCYQFTAQFQQQFHIPTGECSSSKLCRFNTCHTNWGGALTLS